MQKNQLTSNGAFRKKKVNFTQVSNLALRDKNLSLRARGLYATIQSYITLEDFIIYKNYLVSICSDGKSSFDRAWDELKVAGYLVQYQMQDDEGKIYYEYDLLDEPRKLSEEEKLAAEQKEANRVARNKRKADKQKAKKQPLAEIPPMEEIAKTTDGNSINGSSMNGNSTSIINTDSNNTDLNNIDNKKQLQTDSVVVVDSDVYLAYTNSFGNKPSNTTKIEIKRLESIIGADTVAYAIEETGKKAKGWDYARGMLNNWVSQGLKDLYDVVMNSENRSRVM